MVPKYTQAALSYLYRSTMWAPIAALVVYLLIINLLSGSMGLLSGDAAYTASASDLEIMGIVLYLWAASLAIGNHLRMELSASRSRVVPDYARVQRVMAAAWLGAVVVLPALLGLIALAPTLRELGGSAFLVASAIGSGAAVCGLWTGYTLPWGIALPAVASMSFALLAKSPLGIEATSGLTLVLSAAFVLLMWLLTPEDRDSNRNQSADRSYDSVDIPNPTQRWGRLGAIVFSYPRIEAPDHPGQASASFFSGLRHWRRGLPSLRWWISLPAGLWLAWFMLRIASANGTFAADQTTRAKLTILVGVGATMIAAVASSWLADVRASRKLSYNSLRPIPREQYVRELASVWFLHGLELWLPLVALPTIIANLMIGKPIQALWMLGWFACAFVYTLSGSILDARLKDRRSLVLDIGNFGLLVLSAAAMIKLEEMPHLVPVAWLFAGLLIGAYLYRNLMSADWE